MKRIIQLILFSLIACAANGQRVKLLQLERYLGDSTGSGGTFKVGGEYYRQGYVGLTDTLGDQHYRKLDSIIVSITDSLIGLIPSDDTDHQYFDTIVIVNDTLNISIIRDGLATHRIPLTGLSGDHDWYEVGSTNAPTNINQYKYSLGKIIIGENASYPESFAVRGSDMRVRDIQIGIGGSGATDDTNLRMGKNALNSIGTGWGYENVAIGIEALYSNDFGINNFAAGAYAMRSNTTGQLQVGIGSYSLYNLVDGASNVAIGAYSMYDATSGMMNVALGAYAVGNCIECIGNVGIGYNAVSSGSNNTGIGAASLASSTGNGNVAIGTETGFNNLGDSNVFIGFKAGFNEVNSKTLYIENSPSTTPLIWGDFDGDTIRINGSLQVTNRTGVGTTLAGWRGSDNKAVNIGIGPGLEITDGVLYVDTVIQTTDTIIFIPDTVYQYLDTFIIVNDILRASIWMDGQPYKFVDLSPYVKQTYAHSGTTSYTNELSLLGGSFTLESYGAGIAIAHNGVGLVTIENTGLVTLDFNGVDDAYSATTLISGNTLSFDGTGGITAKLAGSGSTTLLIDGSNMYWNAAASSGTPAIIGDGVNETVTWVGSGRSSTSISGNTITVATPAQTLAHSGTGELLSTLTDGGSINIKVGSGLSAVRSGSGADGIITISNDVTDTDTDNYVDALTFNASTYVLTVGRTGVLSDLTATVMDHDWYKVGTSLPPNNTEDARRNGLTGIGMDPVYILDVVSDARITGHQIGTGPFVNTRNLRFGLDALNSNVSGTDLIAIGKYALTLSTSSHTQIAIGNEALYNYGSGFGQNIAIGKYAMYTTTGAAYDNTIIGHGALFAATSSSFNTVVGHESLYSNLRGGENAIFGDWSVRQDTASYSNSTLGRYTMQQGMRSLGNLAAGYEAMNDLDDANYNVALGYQSIKGTTGPTGNQYNIGIGYRPLADMIGSGDNNIAIGRQAGEKISGNRNIIIGNNSLAAISTVGDGNISIGDDHTQTTASNNVILGYGQNLSNSSGNVVITNGLGTLAMRMLSTGLVGIGEATPTQKLHVAGSIRVTGQYYDFTNSAGTTGQVLTKSASGPTWTTPAAGGGTNLSFSNSSGTVFLTSSTGNSVSLVAGTGIGLVGTGGNVLTFTNTGDASSANEGSLTATGTGPILINSNTSGSTPITIANGAGEGLTITRSGNTLTFNGLNEELAFTGSNPVNLKATSTNFSGVNFTAGTGISFSSVSSSNITINSTATGTVTSIAVATPTGIGVSPGSISTSGTFTFTLNNDLQSLEAISNTGIAVRTGASTWDAMGFTSLPTGLSSNQIVTINGSANPTGTYFTGLATGFTSGWVLWTDASNSPEGNGNFVFNSGTSTLTVNGRIEASNMYTTGTGQFTNLLGTNTVRFSNLPTHANDAAAAAGGLTLGYVYQTSGGELRIKL